MSLFPLGLISQGGGAGGGAAFELISTTVASGSTSTVTFDVSSLASTYKHLQVRATFRSNTTANWADFALLRFNSDTTSNYSSHYLLGDSGTTYSGYSSSNYILGTLGATASDEANVYGSGIIDILDAFSTTKYKTTRAMSGTNGLPSYGFGIYLTSGNWRSTSAITSISLVEERGVNFIAGSRFSIYGVRG